MSTARRVRSGNSAARSRIKSSVASKVPERPLEKPRYRMSRPCSRRPRMSASDSARFGSDVVMTLPSRIMV